MTIIIANELEAQYLVSWINLLRLLSCNFCRWETYGRLRVSYYVVDFV